MLNTDRYSLHINCGGEATRIGKIYYEGDNYNVEETDLYIPFGGTWEISNTRHFWYVDNSEQIYTTKNVSILQMNNSELYTSARLSPLSLTYHARCLANGNYTVKLHFSEIIIRGTKSFRSLGRRIFDVYIQVILT